MKAYLLAYHLLFLIPPRQIGVGHLRDIYPSELARKVPNWLPHVLAYLSNTFTLCLFSCHISLLLSIWSQRPLYAENNRQTKCFMPWYPRNYIALNVHKTNVKIHTFWMYCPLVVYIPFVGLFLVKCRWPKRENTSSVQCCKVCARQQGQNTLLDIFD